MRYLFQDVAFEWDPEKAAANRTKHGIEFELACEAFFDPFLVIVDAGVQGDEARQAVLGLTLDWRLLYIVFVEREETIRLISARGAAALERRLYESQ